MLKLILIFFTVFLCVACSSVNQVTSPPNASDYLKLINKKLSEKSGGRYIRKPKVFSTNIHGSVETSSSACTVNGIADDGGTVHFYFKRFCNMYDGKYIKNKCLNSKNKVVFSTKSDFSRTCQVAGADNLNLRTLTITQSLNTRKNNVPINDLGSIEVGN